MTARWIMPALAAAVAGALAFGVARHVVCRPAGPSLDRLEDVSFLTRALRLSDAQAREIKTLHATLGSRLSECCARHCAARVGLGQALAADTNGAAQADAILAEMCRAYEQSERATLNHIRAVRAVLNAEQRRRFDAMISDCMCKPCGMPGGSCRTDADGVPALEPPEE